MEDSDAALIKKILRGSVPEVVEKGGNKVKSKSNIIRLIVTMSVLAVRDPAPLATQPWQVGYRMMALEVDDMEKTVEYLKSQAVEITRGPVTIGKSKRAEIKDPNGISIELRQW